MRERCDTAQPSCNNCHKKGRKWKLGCIRETLDSRTHVLFPSPISGRYGTGDTSRYIENSGFFYLDRPDFELQLTTRLPGGSPIPVRVKEIEPVHHERLLHYYQSNVNEGRNSDAQFWDPPIVLYLTDRQTFFGQTRLLLKRAMQEVFTKKHENGYLWPWDCFDFPEMDWLGEVVELIHTFSQGAMNLTYFSMIHKADSLLFFNYLLDHAFLIDGDQRNQLFANLSNPPTDTFKWISSETITRSLKAVIFPFMDRYSKEVLSHLHELLLQMSKAKEVSSARNDLAFCLSFLMLVVLGQNQARLVSLADLAAKGEKGIDLSKSDAEDYIRNMETQLGDFIIQFHEFAIKKRRQPAPPSGNMSKPEEQYAARFGLMDRITVITQSYRAYTRNTTIPKKTFVKAEKSPDALEPESFELEHFGIEHFEARNIHRLCWRFVDGIVEWRAPT
jgi:hypothetical protein